MPRGKAKSKEDREAKEEKVATDVVVELPEERRCAVGATRRGEKLDCQTDE